MLIYNYFARMHDWPPRVVDELTLEELDWLPICEEASNDAVDVLSAEQRAQNRKAY